MLGKWKTKSDLIQKAKVLTEAEEERVHTHGVDTEETMGDEVGSHHYRLSGHNHTCQDKCSATKPAFDLNTIKSYCFLPVLEPNSSLKMEQHLLLL